MYAIMLLNFSLYLKHFNHCMLSSGNIERNSLFYSELLICSEGEIERGKRKREKRKKEKF